MTALQIETAARRRLNAAASTFWSQAEILEECLYSAMLDMAGQCRVIEGTQTCSTVASTQGYAFSSFSGSGNIIDIKHLTYSSRPLELITEEQYDAMLLNMGTAPSGTPTHFFVWDETVVLYPTPDAVATLSARVVELPARPADPYATALTIPARFHQRLVDGTAYYMLLKETDDPRTPIFEARWERALARTTGEWTRSKNSSRFGRVLLEETSVINGAV